MQPFSRNVSFFRGAKRWDDGIPVLRFMQNVLCKKDVTNGEKSSIVYIVYKFSYHINKTHRKNVCLTSCNP